MQPFAKLAALAVIMVLTAVVPARAASVSADDTARFLAGMPPSAGSPLTPLTQDPAWQHHARRFDAAFAQLEARQLAKIRTWANTNLAAPHPTMFYMFSGPDFLYADAFYSRATTYVLSGLEPVGSAPDLTRLSYGGLGYTLYNVERSLGSILSFSFFITKSMKTDLRAGPMSGTLPILYVFLARSGKSIRSVSLITLDASGGVHSAGETPGNAARGVRIVFAGSDGVERTLYYFSTDLSNSGVRNSGFLQFCAQAGARRQPDQERVLSAARRQLHRPCAVFCSPTVPRSSRTIPVSPWPITIRENGGSCRSAATPVRLPNSRECTSRNTPSCSEGAARLISELATGGDRSKRTCCWRSGCPDRARIRPHQRTL